MKSRISFTASLVALTLSATTTAAPFGGADDTAYADKLWQAMTDNKLVGEEATLSTPYTGTHPHGAILDTIDSKITVGSNEGIVIIKRNYGGEDVSKMTVANDPDKYLKAVTVMYKRTGYEPAHKDWFWVKYAPDGKILNNPKGTPLAGRIGKDANAGCIACHKAAPGDDLVYNNDRFK